MHFKTSKLSGNCIAMAKGMKTMHFVPEREICRKILKLKLAEIVSRQFVVKKYTNYLPTGLPSQLS